MVVNKLNSGSYRSAMKQLKDNEYAIKRTKLLMIRVMTRIEKINLILSEETIGDKYLKTQISLLSQLIGVKKQLKTELKEYGKVDEKNPLALGDLLS